MGRRKAILVFGICVFLLFVTLFGVVLNVPSVRGSGTIYIRADGSINPFDAPIFTIDKITYTFTANIYDSIVVERDNIIVDGAGYAVQGTGSGRGIDLSGRNNVTIKNADIKGFYFGIYLDRDSYGNTVFGNDVKNNRIGIELYGSGNTISENNIATNDYGIEIRDCSGNQIFGNTITANGQTGISLEGYGLAPERTRDNVISGNTITKNQRGVGLGQYARYNSVITNNITENASWGIEFYGSNNNVSGNHFERNIGGIYIFGSGHTIFGNNVTNNSHYGILIQDASNISLRNNIMISNKYNFGLKGSQLSNFIHDIDTSNIIDGKPVYYWVNKHNAAVPLNAGYVGVANSTNITINELEIKNNYQGVLLAYIRDSTIANNTVTTNLYGICLYASSGNNIAQNNITSNSIYGIHLDGSHSNALSENNMTNNTGSGMRFDWSHNNIVSKNNIIANENYGIWLSQSSDNDIFGDRIENNNGGIRLSRSSDNKFYHNYFINNTPQVHDDAWDGWTASSINIWDDDYPSGGNYWSDYIGVDEKSGSNQDQPGSDGIGDTPYVIDVNNRDRYPLMPQDTSPPITTINLSGALGDNDWFTSDVTVTLSATDNIEVKKTEYSFDNSTWAIYTVPFIITNEGTTTVYYKSTDKAGNPEPINTKTIKIDKTIPSANAGQDQTVNVGATVSLDAGASSDNVGIVSYEWDFGDGTSGTGVTSSHVYSTPDIYTVTLTVKDEAGNTATDSITLTVQEAETPPPPPTEGFPMWMIGAAVATAAVIAATTAILWKKRK